MRTGTSLPHVDVSHGLFTLTSKAMSDVPIPEMPARPPSREDRLPVRLQAFVTLLIAFAAIALTIWEGVENRRHNRLSVQPRLGAAIDTGRDTAGEYVRMAIESTGLGPAVIKTFRVYFDGVAQDTVTAAGTIPWQNAIDAFSANGTNINAHGLGTGYYIPAGRQQILFEARRHTASDNGPTLTDILRRFALQICYCSVYNTDCEEVLLTTARISVPTCKP